MTRDDFQADITDQMKALKHNADSKAADAKLELEALRKDINTSKDTHQALQAMKNDLTQTVDFAMDDLQGQLRATKENTRATVSSVQGDLAATRNLNLDAQNVQTKMKTMLANISQQLREAKEEREREGQGGHGGPFNLAKTAFWPQSVLPLRDGLSHHITQPFFVWQYFICNAVGSLMITLMQPVIPFRPFRLDIHS